MDVIYYGTDLQDWIEREQHGEKNSDNREHTWGTKWEQRDRIEGPPQPVTQYKEIPFWSDAVRKNNAL
jgi:hypothetical protein